MARVGERTITLGDYVSALDRMDHFERLRYQTPERRKQLLDEMINVELLAREAERRGLDQQPETQAHITQLLREELVSELRRQQPKVEELPASEVKRYYDDHPDEFQDPERRRVAVIATASAAQAKKNLAAVAGKSAKTWGKVARESGAAGGVPLEFEGDLGLVSAPGQQRGSNNKVPEAVRAAVFKLEKQGEIYPEVVAHEGKHYVVRLMAISPPRRRTLAEVDTIIRVRLLQQRLDEAERALDDELRKQIPVQLNEAAIQRLELPAGVLSAGGRASQ